MADVATPAFRPVWGKTLLFVGFHVAAVVGVALVGVRAEWVALAVGLYLWRVLATTLALHRYFSHRAFRTSRPVQLLLGL